MRSRLAIVGIAALAAVLIGVVAYMMMRPVRPDGSAAQIGGPVTLVDASGRAVTERDLQGKPSVIYFGFTYCPEACPTTLMAMGNWIKDLGPDADKLNFVFVTIDPERDTPAQMKLYLSAFDPRIRGFTGTPSQIARIAHAYGVYYQKVKLPGGGYTMDHSTVVYLMDAAGKHANVIAYEETPAQAEGKLRALVGR